ncbi:hypothetical protein SYNPS1DRAFT_27699 [Syncephalis pseudoplumigaleata]|uniref:RING-type domain-containing protein n=1 Tax=Syncephalis pseudoplumigaleata TaxID=1712513 RepID=A0A4P9Z470_9FUNG|nr:hypothetical protein SYNPS1DRAFT_27699 [Syncephalis pseudoplumigaleata]|eukprot:RKP26621.1 hypothetical protein SYNPS1DRAFT_27699 [Syncephalis pseudoplumigaleata]
MQPHQSYAEHPSNSRRPYHDKQRASNGKRPAQRPLFAKPYGHDGTRSKRRGRPDVLMLKSEQVLCFCGLPATRTESPDIGGVYDCHYMSIDSLAGTAPGTSGGTAKLHKGLQASRRVREEETAQRLLDATGAEPACVIPELKTRHSLPKLEANWQSHPDRRSPPLPALHWRSMRNALKQHWERTIDAPICCFHVHEDAWREILDQERAWFDYGNYIKNPNSIGSSSGEPPPVRPSEIYPHPTYENPELMMCPWFNTTYWIAFRSGNQGPRQFMQLPRCYCGDPVAEDREQPGTPSGRRYRFICSHAKEGQPNRCAWMLWAEHVPFEQPEHPRHPIGPKECNLNDDQILNQRRSSVRHDNTEVPGIQAEPPDPNAGAASSSSSGAVHASTAAPSTGETSAAARHDDEDGPVWVSSTGPPPSIRNERGSHQQHEQQAMASTTSSSTQTTSSSSPSTANHAMDNSNNSNSNNDAGESMATAHDLRKRQLKKKKKAARHRYPERDDDAAAASSNEYSARQESRAPPALVSIAVQTSRSRSASRERVADGPAMPASPTEHRPDRYTPAATTTAATAYAPRTTHTSYSQQARRRTRSFGVHGQPGAPSTSSFDATSPPVTTTAVDSRVAHGTATSPPPVRARGGHHPSSSSSSYGRVNVILPPPIDPVEPEPEPRPTSTHHYNGTVNNNSGGGSGGGGGGTCSHCHCHAESRQSRPSSTPYHSPREEPASYAGPSTSTSQSYYQQQQQHGYSSTEEETRRHTPSTRWSSQHHDPPHGTTTSGGGGSGGGNNATMATTTTGNSSSASYARTVPRGRAPLPPPLPDPPETTSPPPAPPAAAPAAPSSLTQPPSTEDIALPARIDAQRDAFRRLQEELLELKRTNRRFLNENLYLRRVIEELEGERAELVQMATRNEKSRLAVDPGNQHASLDGSAAVGEDGGGGGGGGGGDNAGLSTLAATNAGALDDAASQISIPTEWRCRICYEQPISHVIIPCGHAVTCEHCALTLNDHCCA